MSGIILGGDLNIHHKRWLCFSREDTRIGSELNIFLDFYGLNHVVREPTRNEYLFDLVISDIGLPDGNGYDLMAGLRAEQQLKGIALTGYGMESDIARSQTAGFLLHLTKPIRADELETAIATARSGEAVPLSSPA